MSKISFQDYKENRSLAKGGLFSYIRRSNYVIEIKVKQTEKDCLIEIHGHAHYAPSGYDIVCSAISTLYATLANSIDMTSDALCRMDESEVNCKTLYISNLDLAGELAIEFFRIGCKGVQEAYPANVSCENI